MSTAQDVTNRAFKFMGEFAISVGLAFGALASEICDFQDQMGDTWRYVISDVGVTIVGRLGEMRLYNSAFYRREAEIPAVIDGRPVVSIDLEHGALIDTTMERCSILTIPASITNITGLLDRNDPDCKCRNAGDMYSVEALRFLGDVPKFPALDPLNAESFPFSTFSKVYVPRRFAESWTAFLAQLGMSVAGYVNEDTDCLGVTVRTKIDDRVWTYRIGYGDTATLCRWNESEAACMPMTNATMSVPSVIDGRTVVALDTESFGNWSWDGCATFTELTIPDSVTNVGAYAFFNCTNLQRLVIGSGIASAFEGGSPVFCYWDEEGQCQVGGLPSLTFIDIRSEKGIDVLVPDGIETSYPNVTDMVIAEDVNSVPLEFFYAFPNLKNLQAAPGVGPVTESDVRSFVDGHWWRYYVAGGWAHVIEVEDFYGGHIVVPDELDGKPVVSLSRGSMIGAWNVTLGKNVRMVDVGAFGTPPGRSEAKITVSEGNEHLVVTNGLLCNAAVSQVYFVENGVTDMIIPDAVRGLYSQLCSWNSNLKSVVFPEGMSSVGDEVFSFSAIESVTFPSTMTSIGVSAFFGCEKLQNVVLPASLKTIDMQAFCRSGLRDVCIPDSVTNVGINAFSACRDLTNVTFGASVAKIDMSAFRDCTNLVQMTFRGDAPAVGYGAFADVPTSCKVFVAKESTGWGTDIPGVWNGMSIYWVGDDPAAAAIPDLGDAPDRDAVAGALSAVEDPGVRSNVDESNYVEFRAWAGRVKAKGSRAAAGFAAVQASPLAWLSYAVASDTLIDRSPTDGQVKVEEFAPGTAKGAFDFVVGVEDMPIGDDAKPENLAKVFGIEGGASLRPDAFSSDNVSLVFDAPEGGKVRFTAVPKDADQGAFFMRVKMTP